MTSSTLTANSFQFKASFIACAVLQLIRSDLSELEEQLVLTIQRAPNLFQGSLVIIDLEKILETEAIDFAKLKTILLRHGMIPIGVRGGSHSQQEKALLDFPVLPTSKINVTEINNKKNEEVFRETKIVTTPIRSGMQVYAKERDLIVTSAVSPGAELFSDGNIHVYGALRGRAMAGVQGNRQARIFCRTLEAELVSIAGYYLTKEDIPTLSKQGEMVQIYLDNAQVRIETL